MFGGGINLYKVGGVVAAVVVFLLGAVGVQSYRLNSAQSALATQKARTASVERSRDELRGMYTRTIENLTTELSEAQRRTQKYNRAKESNPEARNWSEQEIPESVREALNG